MKKYSFLVYHKEYPEFLEGIQGLGVLHVIEKESGELEDEDTRNKYQLVNRLSEAIKFLQKREVEPREKKQKKDPLALLEELKDLRSDQEEYLQQLAQLKKERMLLEPWGDFEPESIEKLRDAGYVIDFYTCQTRNFDPAWKEDYTLEIINESGGYQYFILVHKEEESIALDAEIVSLPENSLTKVDKLIAELNSILAKTEAMYDQFAANVIPDLIHKREVLIEELKFNKVVLNTQKEAEEKLMFLEGWVPAEVESSLKEYLDRSGVYYESTNPVPEDNPPIKLKNSKFARLYEPVGELYTMPDYKEIDLTPFFAPFFMMFFGFCLGDVGYGLVILAASLILMTKVKGNMKSILALGSFLGAATVIMGFVSGTFFGVNLLETKISWLESSKKFMLDTNQLMMLSFLVGGIQTIFGMGIKAANRAKQFGFVYALSTMGWIFVILSAVSLFALKQTEKISPEQFKLYLIITGSIGGFFIFFMNSPGKNPFLNLGLGIWDTYGMASGLLGDLLSYVRLFALGISSAVLGNVFNQLAFSLSPDIIVVRQLVILLILLFGHGLNFFMSALGSFVHPLRLTFVEFYKNAGFSGGGKKYDPFRRALNIE